MESEKLSIPTLENVPEKVQKAFNAQVSKKVGDVRKILLANQSPDFTEGAYLKTAKAGESLYQKRYASVLLDVEGAENNGTHITKMGTSITVDLKTGNPATLSDFVRIPAQQLNNLQTTALKQALVRDNAAEDPFGVLKNVGQGAWMVSDKGITFRYYQMYEGGWDYTFTLPWSQLR